MEKTVVDFWCMVWEQGVSQIVMLTNTEERGMVTSSKLVLDIASFKVLFSMIGEVLSILARQCKLRYIWSLHYYIRARGQTSRLHNTHVNSAAWRGGENSEAVSFHNLDWSHDTTKFSKSISTDGKCAKGFQGMQWSSEAYSCSLQVR